MATRRERVAELKGAVEELRSRLCDLEHELARETKRLQRECDHEEYDVESDGDVHRPGKYYTCKQCGYFTKFRPVNLPTPKPK